MLLRERIFIAIRNLAFTTDLYKTP